MYVWKQIKRRRKSHISHTVLGSPIKLLMNLNIETISTIDRMVHLIKKMILLILLIYMAQ